MTEAEWNAAEPPEEWLLSPAVLNYLRGWCTSDRKLRLFAVACARRLAHLLPDDSCRQAILIAERHADGLASDVELAQAQTRAQIGGRADDSPAEIARSAAIYAAHRDLAEAADTALGYSMHPWLHPANRHDEARFRVENLRRWAWLHDIVGHPFTPETFAPAWRSANAVAVADSIYSDRAFDRLPILADALEDAGCTSRDILDHCRQPGVHVRGCWVVDLVLGKE